MRCTKNDEAGEIEHGAADHDAPKADAHRQCAGDRLQEAPCKILHRDRQREVRDRDRDVARERLHEQAKALPQPHAEAQHDGGARQEPQDRTHAAPLFHHDGPHRRWT